MTSGLPLGGVLMKKEYDVLEHGMDERVYGGHPVACQIALHHIANLEEPEVIKSIHEKSGVLSHTLTTIESTHKNIVKHIRTYGLIGAVEFTTDQITSNVYDACLKNGLIIKKSMSGTGNTLILKPSLYVEKEEIKQAGDILKKSIKETT